MTTADPSTTPIQLFLPAKGINDRVRQCHPVTLRRALRAGRIKGTLHGNRFYYDVQSVIAWMQGTVPPKKPRPTVIPRRRGRPSKKEVAA